MMLKNLIVISFLFLLTLRSYTQSGMFYSKTIAETLINNNVKGSFGIDVEQDWLIDWLPNKNFDRNYTQGTGLFYSKPQLDNSILFFPVNIIERLNRMHLDTVMVNLPATIAIGATAFTPRVLDSPIPIVGDRPFAGLMYISTIKNRYNLKTKALIQTSFNYGLLGTNVTNAFQSFAHQHIVRGRPTVISWHHQISEGGHFAFLFSHQVTKSLVSIPLKVDSGRNWLELALGYKINVGWYTGVSAPLRLKFGYMTVYAKNASNLDASLSVAHKMRDFPVEETKWEGYFFSNITPRITPYNSLILGQPNVKSIYTLSYEDYNPFILDIEYGFVVSRLRIAQMVPIPVSRFDVILAINHRSSEIRNSTYKRWHHWGRISLRFPLF